MDITKVTDEELQELLDKSPYGGQRYTSMGVPHAKAGLKIFRLNEEDNMWDMISSNGIENERFGAIRIGRGGRII